MPPAARVGDMHVCPMVTPGVPPIPHVGGPILPPGGITVLIGGQPAARMGDMCVCVGPPDTIAMGSPTVLIGSMMAARIMDPTMHGGMIAVGFPTVMIGESGGGSAGPGGGGGAAGASSVGAGLVQSKADTPIDPHASEYANAAAVKDLAGAPPPDCSFLNRGFRSSGTPANFDANRRKPTIGTPKKIKYTFPGGAGPVDATSTPVTIDGHTVNVIQAGTGPVEPGTVLPSTDQMASSLGAVPANQYGYIKNVVVSPNRNPEDAYWAQQYNSPGFRSEATAGAAGDVTWYPIPKDSPMIPDETMIHESGHAYSKNIWPQDKDWKIWEDAMKADPGTPSDYAKSSKDEDFSESLVMYSMSKGTPCEAQAKTMFPTRYKILDVLLAPKPAK